MTTPVVGHLVILGYRAAGVIAGVENAIVVGGLTAIGLVGRIYDTVLEYLPHPRSTTVEISRTVSGADWQPDVREELRLASNDDSHEMPPYIRRTTDNRLLVTVTEPVERDRHNVGIVLLTRDAVVVDSSLFAIRMSILGLFLGALVLTILLSWYLSLTLARPILLLADAAQDMREGHGRTGAVPKTLLRRRDEIGALGQALSASATALWGRMDAIERFAADVAHEIKNPLSSIRSAIDTLKRVGDPAAQARLLAIMQEDVVRLDRLITDISDASRVDAELSRTATEPVDVVSMVRALGEIAEATRREGDPALVVDAPEGALPVQAVEGRLVQVLRNLIGNAQSFSPPGGTIYLRARETGNVVEIAVEDIRKMRLALVSEVDMDTWEVVTEEVDDEESMVEAARYLRVLKSSVEEKKVRGMVLAEDEVLGEESAQHRKEILEEFDGTLFREQVWPNPTQRGPRGMAELRLKVGAAPVVGRNIHLKGERLEAQKQLEADWKRDRKIEPGRGP